MLDVYAPQVERPGGGPGAPILVFVHGGAFVRGDKEQTPWIYANVPAEFSRHGYLAFNVEYRLAPQSPWPGGAEDVREALRWVVRHAARWGGDPSRLFLMGHSAACAHCASALWDARVRPDGGLPVAGLVLVSPRVVADTRADNPNAHGVRAYYGEDEALYAGREPLGQARPTRRPPSSPWPSTKPPDLRAALAQRLAVVADRDKAHAAGRATDGPQPREHRGAVQHPFNALGGSIRDWFARARVGWYAGRRPSSSAGAALPPGRRRVGLAQKCWCQHGADHELHLVEHQRAARSRRPRWRRTARWP